MNFTREPIIETVITPREGCKLVVRSSKGASQEDYFVDAVEVVSFGHSFFFRSQERPKSFLVPVSDYEVLETKETRMVIKNPSAEQAIKIGGGRETPPPRQHKEPSQEPARDALADSRPAPDRNQQQDRKRDRRRRGRRGRDRHHEQHQEHQNGGHSHEPREAHVEQPQEQRQEHEREERAEEHKKHEERGQPEAFAPAAESREEVKAPSFISKLFPPPSTLIKETLSRYKPTEDAPLESELFDHPSKDELEDDNEE